MHFKANFLYSPAMPTVYMLFIKVIAFSPRKFRTYPEKQKVRANVGLGRGEECYWKKELVVVQ